MVQIFIDNNPYEADGRINLLQACLGLGFNVPYFCWHPALGAVGACRQCAVKQFRDEHDTKGRIVMSCMTPVTEGMRISIDDPEVLEFRESVIEWLMTNHPHDCPVCDEGGHCHLQDMTCMTGHTYRRYRFPKRTYRNQYLGPFLNHEMNRCIQCYRCVRFYRDYAGGRDFNVFASHNHVYFGRYEDGVLENPFSGNLGEICPTGVFTDKTLGRHYTRKWDMQMAPSVCTNCGVGCNTTPAERYQKLRRVEMRFHSEVNGYFLCDRGRYGYEYVNHALRLRTPLREAGGDFQDVTPHDALHEAAELLAHGKGVIGIGSPRASLEANFALRTLVGPERFFSGMEPREHALVELMIELLRAGPARSPSLKDIERSDAVLVLGEDLTNTAPMMDFAVRQSVRNQPMNLTRRLKIPDWLDAAVRNVIQDSKGPCFIATPAATQLDAFATGTLRGAPDEIARLGLAVAHAIAPDAPGVDGLSEEQARFVDKIAGSLKGAKHPVILSGPGLGSDAVIQAAAAVAWALCVAGKPAQLGYAMPECNSMGLGLMGARPLNEAFQAVREGEAEAVIVLENDLYRRAPAAEVDALFTKARVVALDHYMSDTVRKAALVFPAATFAEADGSMVNAEGRAQRYYQVYVSESEIRESWRWLADIQFAAGRGEGAHWRNFDDVVRALATGLPVFKEVESIAPPADFRVDGLKLNRQPHRYSGRTAMFANKSVHEPKPPEDLDTPLAFSMEGYQGMGGGGQTVPPAVIPFFWQPGWNSTMQSLNKYQEEVGGPLRGGPSGKRLIEAQAEARPALPMPKTLYFAVRSGEWLVVPFHHIFGSEELSVFSPGVGELAPSPYIALSPEDFSAMGLAEGDLVRIGGDGAMLALAARLEPTLPRGLAGVPRGLPGLKGPLPLGWRRLERMARA